MKNEEIENLIKDLVNFQGVKYKKAVGKAVKEFSKIIPESTMVNVLNYDDDAAYIDFGNGDKLILVSTDGIRNEYTSIDPWGAGYYGVVVNVKDIVAMGGKPIGIVNVICYREEKIYQMILDGMYEGAEKFGIVVLGGHVCPDSNGENVSIAILGEVKSKNLIKSSSAKIGERIVYVADLNGRILPTWKLGWDSTSMKSKVEVRSQFDALNECFDIHIFNAGKDVSNAGLIGTIGMLCEASNVGAVIRLNDVKFPPEVNLELWLKMNPGFGFVFTVEDYEKIDKCKDILERENLTIMDIGYVTDTKKLQFEVNDALYTVWDFKYTSLYGNY